MGVTGVAIATAASLFLSWMFSIFYIRHTYPAMNFPVFAVVKDKEASPPVYTVFFKAKDTDAITRILQDYSAKQVKKPSVEKTSVLEKLKKFKEIVAAIPKKVAEKKKERSR